jgi:alpha-glucosidase
VIYNASKVADGVVFQGSIVMPFGATELWTMTLLEVHGPPGPLAFRLNLENKSGGAPPAHRRDQHCGTRIQACYTYASVDVTLLWNVQSSERIVGGGEQFSAIDLRGQRFDIWSGEQGIGRGRWPVTSLIDADIPFQGGGKFTTYSSVPAFLSSRGYGISLENTQLVGANFETHTAGLTVVFEDRMSPSILTVSGHVFGADSVRSLLPPLTSVTGRMSAPPGWVLGDGLILGTEGGHELVSAQLEKLLLAKVPVAAVWIQDWSGMVRTKDGHGEMVWWNWELDETRYPKAWFQDLKAKDIRVLTYINPMLAATPSAEGKPPSVFLEAQRLGHLLKDSAGNAIVLSNPLNGVPYGQVDLLRDDAWEWWVHLLRCNVMLACSDSEPMVSGWMHDYGEQLLMNASVPIALGTASDVHNLYPDRSLAAAHAATSGFDNVTFFARSGGLHAPGFARMFWLGDQLTSFDGCDGLQSAVIGAMSGGMSGWTVTGTDLGGFTMIDVPVPGAKFTRDSELLVRWLEVGVFLNSMFRSHPGVAPNSSAQLWHDDVINHTKRFSELFRALRPYRDALFADAEREGLPLVRHGLLVYPHDSAWFERREEAPWGRRLQCDIGNEIGLQQFFLGDDLLVVPVFAAGRSDVKVYLPEGEWVHLWTKRRSSGPSHETWPSPLGYPAAFYRASSPWRSLFNKLSTPSAISAEVIV